MRRAGPGTRCAGPSRLKAAALGAGLLAAALAGCAGDSAELRESVALDGRSPRVPAAERVRVLVDLRRPSLGDRMASEMLDPAAQRAHVASLESEANALLSALRAKDVETVRPVVYGRAWSGFAVTLATDDLPAVQALGLRSEPVRRFYGATSRARAVPLQAEGGGRSSDRAPSVALLDSGVARGERSLRGRVVPVFDAVGRDRDPSPRDDRERHGTAMAGVLAAELPAPERFASIRVAGRQRDAEGAPELEVGTTDQLLAGLERAVDPDGDGDVEDRIPIALVGVSSPYSGFADSPEAEAARAAAAVGTLVVAPAGNEGAATGAFGTLGSPGAAPDALAVGALDGSEPSASGPEGSAESDAPGVPRVDLGLATEEGHARLEGAMLGGGGRPLRAPVTPLTGRSQASPRGAGRAAGGDPLEYLTVDATPKARGRVVVVPARAAGTRPALAERAVAAAGAGAAALVVCDPDSDELQAPLPEGAAGGIPVIGLAGDDAERALELTGSPGGLAFVSRPRGGSARGETRPAAASSRGPTYGLAAKPDLAAAGTATTVAPGGESVFASGTSIAAARVAALAARVRRGAPRRGAAELAAALVGSAREAGPLLAAGAGRADPAAARRVPAIAEPRMVSFDPPAAGARAETVTLSNPSARPIELRLAARLDAPGLRVSPDRTRVRLGPSGSTRLALRLSGGPRRRAGFATGRLTAAAPGGRAIAVPLLVPLGPSPAPRLGRLTSTRQDGEVTGVRFSVGAVRRAPDAIAVEPVGSLRLVMVDSRGREARELTPPGGAPDLLPGEYSYTLPDEISEELDAGDYRFRVTARGTSGGTATAESAPFPIR